MIFQPQDWLQPGDGAGALAAHVRREVQTVCAGLHLDEDMVEQLSRAVACYLEQDRAVTLTTSRDLALLASRALASLGETGAARRMVVFATGLVKPAEWEVRNRGTLWILDLRQMTVQDQPGLELLLFHSLRMILEAMAEVWDRTGGHGSLGLQHVCQTAVALGISRGKKRIVFEREMLQTIRSMLHHIGTQRGWESLPEVLNLDLS